MKECWGKMGEMLIANYSHVVEEALETGVSCANDMCTTLERDVEASLTVASLIKCPQQHIHGRKCRPCHGHVTHDIHYCAARLASKTHFQCETIFPPDEVQEVRLPFAHIQAPVAA